MLKDQTIVVGVSGGIAAYKTAYLVSQLAQQGADVHVIMTEHATHFVTPETFAALSGNPVHSGSFEQPVSSDTSPPGRSSGSSAPITHIALADRASLMVVAPATANLLAKMASGIADDLLTTTLLATKAPILVAPAMNVNMFNHPATQENLQKLQQRGVLLVGPASGHLACGWEGKGRMEEPEVILREIALLLEKKEELKGKKLLITAGATQEPLDPVRILTNPSTGKMGYALAERALMRGAEVVLVTGKTLVPPPERVRIVQVTTAEEMRQAVMAELSAADVFISAAAVTDWRPESPMKGKRKRDGFPLTISLVENPDILEEAGKRVERMRPTGGQILVGFALETEEILSHAEEKLKKKNLDFIVANNPLQEGAGFGSETNIVTILHRDGRKEELPKLPKAQVADIILDRVALLLTERQSRPAQPPESQGKMPVAGATGAGRGAEEKR